jgi:hypothetical protein
MKLRWLVLAALTATMHGQAARYDNSVTQPAGNVPPGAAAPVYTVPNAIITVCGYPAVGEPCTNTVPIFQDQALTIPQDQPFSADAIGRFGFWITAGQYSYSIQTQSGKNVGTFALTLTAGPQGPGGPGCGAAQCIVTSPTDNQVITQPVVTGNQTSLNVNSLNGVLNAASYCTTPGTLDQTCIENAAAVGNGRTIYVPAGNYSGTISTINRSNFHLNLDPSANLNYALSMSGGGFSVSNTVVVAGSVSSGTTTIPGDFTGYSAGQLVVVEQVDNVGTVPVDFMTVVSGTAFQLTVSSPLRFSYSNPHVSKISNIAKITGTIANNAQTISGNYTAQFASGDIIRIENTAGTDSPNGGAFYFEYARVASINSSAITLETGVHSTFGNPWIAKVNVLSNVTFEGYGFIETLAVTNARDLRMSGLRTNVNINQYIYDGQFTNLKGVTSNPSAFYFTFIWNSSISNVVTYGAVGTTDNGNMKILGVQGVSVSNIATWQGTDPSEGEYPLMYDFNYTPYSLWNASDTLTSAAVGSSMGIGGASVFIGGMRNSSIAALTNTGNITLVASKNLTIDGLTSTGQILIQTGNAYHMNNFTADSMAIGQFTPVSDSDFSNFTIAGGASENGGSAVNVLGGSNDRFVHGEFTQSNLTFNTINATATSNNMYYEDIQDYAGTNLLFSVHTNGFGSHTFVGNRFASTVQGPFNAAKFVGISAPGTSTFGTLSATSLSLGGGAAITNSSNIPLVGTQVVGQVTCQLLVGPPPIQGHCSSAVSAGGACTCVP